MKPIVRYALLLSAVVIAGGGVAAAQMDRKPAAPRQYPASPSFGHGRGAAKFFQYDVNHDGKVTRDEMNRALAQQFAQAAGSAPTIGQAQFIAYRMKDLRAHTVQMFRRADWNGDGRLSLDEYMTPERVRFQYADRDGTGVISCGFHPTNANGQNGYHSRGHGGGRGRGAFCKSADLNHDGQVTHAEFDKAMQQEFAAAAKGGSLNADAYFNIIAAHVRDSSARMFVRLDKNHDGKIDRGEFAESQTRYFAKLDRNNDGVVTRDEFYAGRRTASAYSRKPGQG
jgi:Ca2+-binding EF-hand superfamily protein